LVDAMRQRKSQPHHRDKSWTAWYKKQQQQQQLPPFKPTDIGRGNWQTMEVRKNSNYYNLSLQPTRPSSSSHPPPPPTLGSSNQSSVSPPVPALKRNLYYIVPVPTTTQTTKETAATATAGSGLRNSRRKRDLDPTPQPQPSNKKGPTRIVLNLVRGIVLGGLENLIELEAADNAKEKERQRVGKGMLLHRE
jgi:hypothetical protein